MDNKLLKIIENKRDELLNLLPDEYEIDNGYSEIMDRIDIIDEILAAYNS